jgi:hypothetical protein
MQPLKGHGNVINAVLDLHVCVGVESGGTHIDQNMCTQLGHDA